MPDRQQHDGFIWALINSLIINFLFVFALLIQREEVKSSKFLPFVVSIDINQQGRSVEHTLSINKPPHPTPGENKKAVLLPTTLPLPHKNAKLALPTQVSDVVTPTPPESATVIAGDETAQSLTTGGEGADIATGAEIAGGLSIFGDKMTGDHYTAPEFLLGEKPPYPKQAERNGWTGTVLLNLSINAKGEIEKVGIAKSSGYRLLDQQARESVGSWRFKPARRNGHAVAVTVQQPIVFRTNSPE